VTSGTSDKSIHVYDVSDPNSLAEFGSPVSPTTNRNVLCQAFDDKLFLITRKNISFPRNLTLQVWDAADPEAMTLLGEVMYWANGTFGVLALDTVSVTETEEPTLHRFACYSSVNVEEILNGSLPASVNVGEKIESEGLDASVDVRGGEGTIVFVDAISSILDAAR
jgi:hypothetical protein